MDKKYKFLLSKGIYNNTTHRYDHDSMVIIDDKIVWIGNHDRVPSQFSVRSNQLDLSHCYLFPGLINTHVHLEFDASSETMQHYVAQSSESRMQLALEHAHTLLMSGVTTVRDAGSSWQLLSIEGKSKEKDICIPRIQMCGPPITITNGHLHGMGGVADTQEELMEAVVEHHDRGCEAIKIMATGGQLTPGSKPEQAAYTKADIEVIVKTAHELGLPTLAHSLATEGFANCMEGGVDCIEHCGCFVRDKTSGRLKREYNAAVMDQYKGIQRYFMNGLSTCYRSLDGIRLRANNLDENERYKLEQQEEIFRIFRKLLELGLVPVVGTDAGVWDTQFDETWLELVLMCERGGLSTIETIDSATIASAACVGMDRMIGRLCEGHVADIVAVEQNPLEDIEVFNNIPWVMHDGKIVKNCISNDGNR